MANESNQPPSFSGRRRWSIGINVVISVAAALALVIMANYLAARHYARWLWMAENPYQLTELTLDLLHSLTNQVKVVVFWDQRDTPGVYTAVSALLTEYQLACPRLTVETVDYMRNPSTAVLVKERYKLSMPSEDSFRNIVIFDCNGRSMTIAEKQLYDYDISALTSGRSKEIKRSSFKGEMLFTSAIISLTEDGKRKVYFVEGHKEHSPQDDNAMSGYSKFGGQVGGLLQQFNMQTDQLFLNSQAIPEDCQLLIIAGPQVGFAEDELTKIDRYLNRGGRLLVLFNPLTPGPTDLERLLSAWGVKVGHNRILDLEAVKEASKPKPEGMAVHPLTITNFLSPNHPIMKPLVRSRSALHMVLPRSVEKQALAKLDADTIKVEELAASDADCLAVGNIRDGVPVPNPFSDRRGPIPLAVAVEKGSVQGISSDRSSTRIVVVGDSLCFANGLLDSLMNRDFAILSVDWLLDRSRLMGGIGPRPMRDFQVVMTGAQMLAVRWILLGGLPGGVLALGLLVWARRRH
jgi:hypothetical protein